MGKLTYQQIHSKNFSNHRDKILKANRNSRALKTEFYTLKTSKDDYKQLNNLEIPSADLIRQHQAAQIKLMGQKNNAKLKQYVDKINLDFRGLIIGDYKDFSDIDMSNFINMEKVFGTWLTDIDLKEKNKKGVVQESLTNIQQELQENQLTVNNYQILKNSMLELFNNLKKDKVTDNELLKDITAMEQKIASIDNVLQAEFGDASNNQFINSSVLETTTKRGKKTTYLSQLVGFSYRIKGRYLELKAMEYFFTKLSQVSNLLVIDTANNLEIHPDILGNSTDKELKKAKTDALLVLAEDLEKINKLKGKQIYSVDNDTYESLKQVAVGGIQVKSGINQSPFNIFNTTWRQLYSLNGGDGYARYSLMLNSLMQEPRAKYYMYTKDERMEEPLYNPIFNYLLAKGISRIVGEQNNLFASRDGVYFMDEYLEQKLSEGYLIRAKDYVNILNFDKAYGVTFKK